MKYISKPISKAAIAIVPLALAALTVFLISCSKGGSSAKPDNVDYYTCSMDLVPVMKEGTGASAPMGEHAGHAGHEAQMPGIPMESGANAPDASRSDTPTEFTVPVERQQQIGVT